MSWFRAKTQGNIVEMAVELPVNFIEEDGAVVAYSPALDLSTSGATKREAQRMFDEIVRIFFNDLVENGTADEVLGSLGWKRDPVKSSWVPPKISQESVGVRVPVAA